MEGSIILSCGHKSEDYPNDAIPVRWGEFDCDAIEGFLPVVTYADYCPSCAAKAKTWDTYIETDEQEKEWFEKNRKPKKSRP